MISGNCFTVRKKIQHLVISANVAFSHSRGLYFPASIFFQTRPRTFVRDDNYEAARGSSLREKVVLMAHGANFHGEMTEICKRSTINRHWRYTSGQEGSGSGNAISFINNMNSGMKTSGSNKVTPLTIVSAESYSGRRGGDYGNILFLSFVSVLMSKQHFYIKKASKPYQPISRPVMRVKQH
jgi:hypothetical protein